MGGGGGEIIFPEFIEFRKLLNISDGYVFIKESANSTTKSKLPNKNDDNSSLFILTTN